MAYDEPLVERVRRALGERVTLAEINMFGGIAFMLDGHMCCGVLKDELVLRLGTEGAATARSRPHVRTMDFTGRPMKGYVMVAPLGCATDADVRRWTALAAGYVAVLPPKKSNPKLKKTRR